MNGSLRFVRILGLAVLAALVAPAQSFSYPNFSNSAGLTLTPSAAISGTALRVSPAAISQRGAAFRTSPVSVAYGFQTTFTFSFTAPTSGGADGMAFVIHADPRGDTALGNHAGAIGYGAFATSPAGTAIANSLVIELDSYQGGAAVGDTSGNEISVHTNGTGDNSHVETFSIGRITPATNMSSGVHTLRIHYVPGMLMIYLDNLTNPVLALPYSFASGGTFVGGGAVGGLSLVGGDSAWVGFTASSGAVWENHDVHSWEFLSPLPGNGFVGSVGAGGGGPYDVVMISGNAGGVMRSVSVPLATTFSIDVAQPPTTGTPANFYLAAVFGRPAPDALFPLPFSIGDLCFPLPFPASTATEIIVAESFGFGNGLIPATPTPWSFPIPGGLAFPLQLTFQGVIEETPGVFKATNAVTLDVM